MADANGTPLALRMKGTLPSSNVAGSGGDGPWEYRLPDSVREALRLESLVPAERENEEG